MGKRDSFKDFRSGFWAKFFYALTWPIRKPWIVIAVLCVLYVAPITQGVAYNKIHVWYKEQILSLYAKIMGQDFKFSDSGTQVGSRGIDKVVETPEYVVGESVAARRGAFGRVSGGDAPKAVDPFANEEVVSVVADRGNWVVAEAAQPPAADTRVDRAPMVAEPVKQVVEQSVQGFRKLNLKYLDKPKEISGSVKIINANEIKVDDIEIFLYGIYVDPNTSQGVKAENLLREMVTDKKVVCSIIAYTFQDVATAKCFIGGKNINNALVDAGLSNNVALDR